MKAGSDTSQAASISGHERPAAVRHDNTRDRYLPEHRIGRPHDGGVEDAGDCKQDPLDLGRADVLAADLEHVLVALGECRRALLIEPDAVAGAEPAVVGVRGGRRGVVAEVAGEHRRTGNAANEQRTALPGSTGTPSSVSTATSYSGAGLPMPARSVGPPPIGYDTVSVMPYQPTVPTPPGPSPTGMRL